MPIDDIEYNPQFMIYDEITKEHKEVQPLHEVPSLEDDPVAYCCDSLYRLKGSITMINRATSESIAAFCMLRKLILEWLFSSVLQSGDRRKIKRAKRKYKAAKRDLLRRIQNDS